MAIKRSQVRPVIATTPPISVYKVLRLLEAAYAKQGATLDRVQKENKRLRALLKEAQK